MNNLRIIFVQHCPFYGGSSISGLRTIKALVENGTHVTTIFASEGPMLEHYHKSGSQTLVLNHKSFLTNSSLIGTCKNFVHQSISAKQFKRVFKLNLPHLVYINSLVSYSAAAASYHCRIPCIWHIRELFEDAGGEMKIPHLIGKPLIQNQINKFASKIIVNSRAVARNVLPAKSKLKTTVIPNSVSTKFFKFSQDVKSSRKELKLPLDAPIVGIPATLRPVKGHLFFIKAIPEILKQIPNCHFIFSGKIESPFSLSIINQLKHYTWKSQCHFLGEIQSMEHFYNASDLLCVPSRSESFGRVVIEAFAMGKPVIGTAVGGIPEIISDGVDGILVRYGDVSELSCAVKRLLLDENYRIKLSSKARNKAQEEYSDPIYRSKITTQINQTLHSI
jgi:glycosyltransferase involved in cell wall biosynthesis